MPFGDQLLAAVDQARLLGAVLQRLARDLVVVGLVGLAEVGGIGVGDRALAAHPVQRGAGVEAAGERDADLLADRKVLKDVCHVSSCTSYPRCSLKDRTGTSLALNSSVANRDQIQGRITHGNIIDRGTSGTQRGQGREEDRKPNGKAALRYVPLGRRRLDGDVDDVAAHGKQARQPFRRPVGADVPHFRFVQQAGQTAWVRSDAARILSILRSRRQAAPHFSPSAATNPRRNWTLAGAPIARNILARQAGSDSRR